MIDSTNPRILANNIRALAKKIASIVPGTVVEGNPSGSGFNTLLTKIKIGSNKYKLPDQVVANPEGEVAADLEKLGIGGTIYGITSGGITYSTTEFDTGKKWIDGSIIYGRVINLDSAIDISYNSFTSLGITDLGTNVILGGFAKASTNYVAMGIMINNDNGTLKMQIPRLGNVFTNVKTVYIEYIKPIP